MRGRILVRQIGGLALGLDRSLIALRSVDASVFQSVFSRSAHWEPADPSRRLRDRLYRLSFTITIYLSGCWSNGWT